MRILLILFFLVPLFSASQEERDTVLKRCPVYIIDTLTSNNYFLEYQPATVKVYRVKGKLAIMIQQKDQYFTMFFKDKHLDNRRYKIVVGEMDRDEAEVKYSFRSGSAVSFVSVSKGNIETQFDKEKDLWHIKVNGLLSNMASHTVSWYKVKADFYIH